MRSGSLGSVPGDNVPWIINARNQADREAGKLSVTAHSYMLELAAEILTGQDDGIPPTWAMQWGIDNEAAARMVYEEVAGWAVQTVDFIEHPLDPMVGGSPDGLVADHGGIEIKCPASTRNHLAYRLGGECPKEHVAQVQGNMWITGRKWWDFISYDPRIKDLRLALWIKRCLPDPEYVDILEKKIDAFREKLLETLCTLRGDQT